MFGCAAQGSAAPLKVDITDVDPIIIPVPPGVNGAQSSQGDITSQATATGGDGSYSYAWTLTEFDDQENAFAIVSQGTTNVSLYETAIISTNYNNAIPPPPPPPPPAPARYRVSCTVTDGTGATDTAQTEFDVEVGV